MGINVKVIELEDEVVCDVLCKMNLGREASPLPDVKGSNMFRVFVRSVRLLQFATVANVVFPSIYQTFLDGVDILNFDMSWLVSAGALSTPTSMISSL